MHKTLKQFVNIPDNVKQSIKIMFPFLNDEIIGEYQYSENYKDIESIKDLVHHEHYLTYSILPGDLIELTKLPVDKLYDHDILNKIKYFNEHKDRVERLHQVEMMILPKLCNL